MVAEEDGDDCVVFANKLRIVELLPFIEGSVDAFETLIVSGTSSIPEKITPDAQHKMDKVLPVS